MAVCVRSSFQLSFQHKVGVLYCKAGQSTEEEMYNNEGAGPALDEFLDLLGQRVRLKGFTKYRAQLDNKSKIKQIQTPAHTLLILLSADALLFLIVFLGCCDVLLSLRVFNFYFPFSYIISLSNTMPFVLRSETLTDLPSPFLCYSGLHRHTLSLHHLQGL